MTRRKFIPTHEITLERHDGAREIIPICLVDGVGYTREEWEDAEKADWALADGEWSWRDRAVPDGYVSVSARRLGRGSDPRGPSKADKRITLNLRPDQHARYERAAAEAATTLPRWATRELDVAAEVSGGGETGQAAPVVPGRHPCPSCGVAKIKGDGHA